MARVETRVDPSGTSGRERGSSGADAMMGSGLSTEVVGCDGVGTVSLAGITESLVGVKRYPLHRNSRYMHCICSY